MAGNNGKLFGADGRPISLEPRGLVVLKAPKGRVSSEVINIIAKTTQCSVLVLPLAYELLLGEVAKKELDAAHRAIHSIESWMKKEER